MIAKIISRWEENKHLLEASFAEKHPDSYLDLVTRLVGVLNLERDYEWPDPERVHEIDDGDYQGTLVFVIAEAGYQPNRYWYVRVGYGSCSGCDTLQSITGYSDEKPTEEQVKDYMTLALHVVQGLKEMGDRETTV